MATTTRQAIGLDLGGTKIYGVVADPDSGEIHHHRKVPNPRAGSDELLAAFCSLIDDLRSEADEPIGVGVGLPGLVDRSGVLRYGPNVPGIVDFSVRDALESHVGLPVEIDNDAAFAALAELRFGAARGASDVVVITQGTGIGGALIVDGSVVRGANGFAGEPGHMLIQRGGHRCACGKRGCWEAYSSGAGLVNLCRDLLDEGRAAAILERAGGGRDQLRGEHISAAAAEGDRDALEILDRFAGWVAEGLGSLINLLDPELVVLGGGLVAINEHFVGKVEARLAAAVMGGGHRPRVPVVSAQIGEAAGALGAARSVVEPRRHRDRH